MNRRHVLSLLLGSASVVLIGGNIINNDMPRIARHVLAKHFGEDVLKEDATDEFIADLMTEAWVSQPSNRQIAIRMLPQRLRTMLGASQDEDRIAVAFASRTNALRRLETGEDLIYIDNRNPLETPCANFLSAQYL